MTVVDQISDHPSDQLVIWVEVCGIDELTADRGVCALVGDYQVAIFRVSADDSIYALSNYDPFSGAYVLSRGIVGSNGQSLKVASPIFKQTFDLRTGRCLEDESVSVMTFMVRLVGDRVQVARP